MGKPLFIAIFLLFAAGLALYMLSNSPQFFGPFGGLRSTSTPLGARSSTLVPYEPYNPSMGTYFAGSNQTAGSSTYLSSIPDSQIPQGFTRAQLSRQFGRVRVASAYRSVFGSSPSEIRLYAGYLSQNEAINITGWRVRSNRGEVIITQAVSSYEPSGFTPPSDIILRSGNYVVLYGALSPLARNIRLNKCIGYLNTLYQFFPPLPSNCPLPSDLGVLYLSGQCQAYVRSLGGCQLPSVSFYNQLPGTTEGNACRNFLNGVNYRSCYEDHRSDVDFLGSEWRVWVNRDILDPQHDLVRLYDPQGLLVDQYVY
ncbi:hypothetical protein HY504_02120 [Candidatus Wolfebacteria bacterium]|nr:hypothetical protein [Candidatus Wolfebacteria bacterium]